MLRLPKVRSYCCIVSFVSAMLFILSYIVPAYGASDTDAPTDADTTAATSTPIPATRTVEPLVPPSVMISPDLPASRFVSPPRQSILLSGSVDIIYRLQTAEGEAEVPGLTPASLETLKLMIDGEVAFGLEGLSDNIIEITLGCQNFSDTSEGRVRFHDLELWGWD